MADEPEPGPDEKLETEANDRLKECRKWKSYLLLDFKECYFLSAPHRQRQLTSSSVHASAPPRDAPELNTDLAKILAADFTTEVVNTYLPEAQMWCERGPGMFVNEEAFNAVADDVKAADKIIFRAIKSSNLYAELPKAFNPDLYIGTAGLFIHQPHAHAPIEVLAVPMREMEINLGPNGEIDDRFIVRYTRNCYVHKLIGEAAWNEVDEKTKKEIEDGPAKTTEVRWGWWRKWENIGDECWQHVTMIKDDLVMSAEIKGEGCCAFLVMRFNPSADWPWAAGPLMQGLDTFRQVDELEGMLVENVEKHVSPPIAFPDSSFANVEQGLESNMAYPVERGTAIDIKPIYTPGPPDPAIYQYERQEHQLRKISYCDHPEQSGDTPPTLGQWLDELARMQRRIGTAGYSFWREGPRAIFLRFKYLLEKAGAVKALADKQGRNIATMPYNPTQRAAEQQEIATAAQAAQLLAQMFPEEWRLWVDGKATMEAFIAKMRASGLIKIRSEQDVKLALERIQGLLGTSGLRQKAGPQAPEAAGAQGAI